MNLSEVASGMIQALRRQVVTVVEPVKGPWVNQNLFGDQRVQELPATEGLVVQVLPKNTRMYGPPAVHSVNLSRSDEVLSGNADVRARVTYGCGGIENSFDCDWVHGAQFALVCNSLTVSAFSYRPINIVPYTTSSKSVFLGVMVAKGSVSQGRCPLTYTEQTQQLANSGAAGNAMAFAFPDFAREVTVHIHYGAGPVNGNSNPAVATGVTLEFLNEGGSQIAFYDAQVCAGGRSVPVPGGANKLLVSNTNAGGQVTTTVQWFLGL